MPPSSTPFPLDVTPTPRPTPTPIPLPTVGTTETPSYGHGLSLLTGPVPTTVEIVTIAAVAVTAVVFTVVAWRTGRRRLLWLPASVLIGVAVALAVRTWVDAEGLASDPSPWQLWAWTAVFVAMIPIAVLSWRRSRWWRRTVALLAVPLALLTTVLTLNQWVGYYPTVSAAWGALTAGPLPHQVDADALAGMRNTSPATGAIVEVAIDDAASGFNHRNEYVYLPPAWFAGDHPPALPAVLMIGGEFNTPADWIRSGNIMPIIDDFTADHGGKAPILVFVDAGGSFNNDTECVNGPRGNAADHLTKDVRPYVISQFGASASPANWGVVGWSMGGTCAIDLAVMHPDLFTAFVDIAGDHGPTAGTKDQTVARLYGGDADAWAAFDPSTVMTKHGPYTGVAGLFEDTVTPQSANNKPHGSRPQPDGPSGFGGRDDVRDSDETGAAEDLCATAQTVGIPCEIHTQVSFHTWQFAGQAFDDALPWIAARVGAV
ncbi:MAG: alpha/beta hydrolase-fold protein [Mycolicibacterium insubricum]